MAYPKQTAAFSDVKRIINEEFKMAIEDVKEHISTQLTPESHKTVIKRIKNLKEDLLGNIKEVVT